jgi:Ca2+-transporting ATPase
MGSGASIAKDAGDIILLDDNFRSIIDAVHEGRTIYANIKRMVAYLLSTNAGEVLVALTSLIMGIPVPLAAVQILWVNLVTDTAMVIPLGLEPGERHNMNRPPAKPNAPLFSKFMISRIALVAVTMAVLTITLYRSELADTGAAYARAIAFHALIVMQWANAFNYRSDYESLARRIRRFSGAFYLGLGVAITMQALALFGPLGDFLHIVPLKTADIISTTLIAFSIPIVVVELHKWIGRHFYGKGHLAKPTK